MFTPLEIIALIFSALFLIKIIIVFTNKKLWYKNVAVKIYKKPELSSIILLFIAVIMFFFIIQELSFTQILAVMAFSSILIGVAFMQFSKELMPILEKIYNKKFNLLIILYTLIWIALILTVIKEIFY